MKNIHFPFLVISFLLLILGCSVLSMSAAPGNSRFTWTGMNPWNGVEGIAFSVGYFLHTGKAASILITTGVLGLVWWRLYALLCRTFGNRR